jgi:hypothetical protein
MLSGIENMGFRHKSDVDAARIVEVKTHHKTRVQR